MNITGLGSPYGANSQYSYRLRVRPLQTSPASLGGIGQDGVRSLAKSLVSLRQSIDSLKDSITLRSGSFKPRRASSLAAVTSVTLPINSETGPSEPHELRSSGPVLGTSSSPNGLQLSFAGTSTADVTLGGTYDGSLGTNVELTFLVHRGGTLGEDDVTLRVFDDFGVEVDDIDIKKEDAGDTFQLTSGVSFTVGAGTLVEDESFVLSLSEGDGAVDIDQAFRGSGLPGSAVSLNPSFGGLSTSEATLSGNYAGAFDDTLTFRVSRGGVLGLNDVEIEIFDSNGDSLEKLKFDKDEFVSGAALTFENGLTLALTDGALVKDEEFTLDVRADDELVFAGGQRVQAGSFSVNGVSILVAENDTIASILASISESSAGVSATFDHDSQEILLTPTGGPSAGISFGTDTSGFLTAVGLAGSELDPNPPDPEVPADTRLAGVGTGSFLVNGFSIDVNEQTDTLEEVIERIHAADDSVEAIVHAGRFQIRALDSQQVLTVDNGTSSFFEAFGIGEGEYRSQKRIVGGSGQAPAVKDESSFKKLLRSFSSELNALLSGDTTDSSLVRVRSQLEASIRAAFGSGVGSGASIFNSNVGFEFKFGGDTVPLNLDLRALTSALRDKPQELASFLVESRDQDGGTSGLLHSVGDAVDGALAVLAFRLDSSTDAGLLFDIEA